MESKDSTTTTSIKPEPGEPDFRRGAQLLNKRDFAGAQQAFERARKSSDILQDWATYYAALAAAHQADTTTAQQLFAQLDIPFQKEWAWRARVTAFEKSKAFARGSAFADSVAARLNGPVRRSEALLRSAQLHMAARDSVQAMNAARLALKAGGNSPTGRAAADIMAKYARSTDDLTLVARAFYSSGRYPKAIPLLKRLHMTTQLGNAYLNSRDYASAVKTLKPVKSASAQLTVARAYARWRKPGPAAQAARSALTYGKTGATAAAAYFLIADLADDAGDNARARENYQAAIQASPRSENGVLSFMRLGLSSIIAKDYAGAIRIFEQFRTAHANTDYAQQATFWLAHAHQLAGHKTDADALMKKVHDIDPISYYGLQARIGEFRTEDGPKTDEKLQDAADRAAERVHVLKTVGFTDASAFELYRITQEFNGKTNGPYALAEELISRNEAASAIRLGLQQRTKESSWNTRLLKIVFPMPFEELIKSEARKHAIDPYLVAALIRQESTFDPNALSRVGAVGLMQVMPATAGIKTQQLKVPETNVRIGTAHLKGLIDQYRGQPAYLLAAYNAGQTPVARWLKLPGSGDPLIFAERIPYDETRGYVKIVQRNAGVYRILYEH